MNARSHFTADEVWLKEQPNMDPYPEGCARLLRHLHVWVQRYTPKLCDAPVSPAQPACDGYRQRTWGCWRFHWQPAVSHWMRKPEGKKRPPHRIIDGIIVAIKLVNGTHRANLVRDVILAEAVTQADSRAVTMLDREYATKMKAIGNRTCSGYGEEAWANIFGECFRAPGQRGRLASYQGQRPLASYLATVVTHEVQRLMKKSKGTVTIAQPLGDDGNAAQGGLPSGVEDVAIGTAECDKLLAGILRAALNRLSALHRVVLYFRVIKRLTFEEIGRILASHEEGVKRWGKRPVVDKGTVHREFMAAISNLAVAVEAVIRERKQERSVTECVDQVFNDLRCSDLPELLVLLLRRLFKKRDKRQGRGADEHDQD